MKQESKMVAAPTQPLVSKPDQGKASALYKVIGHVLSIAAGLCIFILHDGNEDTMNKDKNHHSMGPAIVWGTIYGVATKVVDLTQDHSLRTSGAKENMCYLIAQLDVYMLCTMVPGGQSFLAYQMVYHSLIKGKADTLKHVIMAAAMYSICVHLVWKGCLSVDWQFVAITTCVSVAWSTLNNRILHMGDTRMNQVRVDVLLLMGNLLAFDYERFIGPALITVAEQVAYAATKTIAKTQTWYVTSKQEDLVQKECLNGNYLAPLGSSSGYWHML